MSLHLPLSQMYSNSSSSVRSNSGLKRAESGAGECVRRDVHIAAMSALFSANTRVCTYSYEAEYLMLGMVRYGNYSGYYDLAYMFSHYPEDPAARRKTFEYYKLGAAHGDKVAAEELAWCYRTGYGVECDPERADVLEKEAQTMSEPSSA